MENNKSCILRKKTGGFSLGKLNKGWGFEEWKRMLAKRVHKIIIINLKNPHWKIELKKRLLQTVCVSIALLNEIDTRSDGIHKTEKSNLTEYDEKVKKCKAK